jgi:beta-glucosidase-like glycosyl hydrolase
MAIVDRNTLKQWFVRGAKPLAEQFAGWIDAFWHKEDNIPANKVEGLQEAFDSKANKQVVDNLASDLEAHKTGVEAHGDIRQAISNEAETRTQGDAGTLEAANKAIAEHNNGLEAHKALIEEVLSWL